MNKEKIIKITNVSKCYKLYNRNLDRIKEAFDFRRKKYHTEFYALKDINFEVYKGETIGIIGVNGSGKSTLLKILTGVSTQSSGKVEVNGKISALLELGAGFNPNYTGIENIYLNGTIMGYTKEEMEEKLQSIIEFADIGDFIYQPVKNYSSGMFARLAFAVAINVEPEILVVDEALSVGDVFFQNKCFKKMEELRKRNTTILLVSHSLTTITQYCSRSILLNKGILVGVGESKKIVDDYKKMLADKLNNIIELNDNQKKSEEDEAQDFDLIKNKMQLNKDYTEYGTKYAEIIDYGILDEDNKPTTIIESTKDFTIYFKVKFNQDIKEPIFAFTIKNAQGTEICGTNTNVEKYDMPNIKKGETVKVKFKQRMVLQNGEYLLSLGCTEYNINGLNVHHRIYDILCITVIGTKVTVGYFDINSQLSVKVKNNEHTRLKIL